MTIANDFFNRLIGTWENKINGEWKNQFGWDFISQPKFGDPSKDDFTMRVDQMLETITFKVARLLELTSVDTSQLDSQFETLKKARA